MAAAAARRRHRRLGPASARQACDAHRGSGPGGHGGRGPLRRQVRASAGPGVTSRSERWGHRCGGDRRLGLLPPSACFKPSFLRRVPGDLIPCDTGQAPTPFVRTGGSVPHAALLLPVAGVTPGRLPDVRDELFLSPFPSRSDAPNPKLKPSSPTVSTCLFFSNARVPHLIQSQTSPPLRGRGRGTLSDEHPGPAGRREPTRGV